MASLLQRIYLEVGLKALTSSPRDTKVLCLQRLVRLFAYGATTLILALYLASLGFSEEKIGLFMTLTLLGDVAVSLLLTLLADTLGRRRILALGSLLMTASGVVFSTCSNYWLLVFASVIGVISPSGNEVGPFKAIEESTISQLVSSTDRSSIFAWYTLFGTAGVAPGTLLCGWVVQKLQSRPNWVPQDAYRLVFAGYSIVGLLMFAMSLVLSSECEHQPITAETLVQNGETRPLLANGDEETPKIASAASRVNHWPKFLLPRLSPESFTLVLKLCLLFSIDSVASGLTPAAWVIYFFNRKFGLAEGKLGTLFFVSNIISAASNLVASSIARRIGLIKTMVFTHVPASIALALIPLPSNVVLAMALLIFRSGTNSMDQAPRQAFLAAAVLPEERTAVMGLVNVVKTLSQSFGPYVTGALASKDKFFIAFVIAGCLKLVYDALMLGLFLGYQTREDQALTDGQENEDEERESNQDEHRESG